MCDQGIRYNLGLTHWPSEAKVNLAKVSEPERNGLSRAIRIMSHFFEPNQTELSSSEKIETGPEPVNQFFGTVNYWFSVNHSF